MRNQVQVVGEGYSEAASDFEDFVFDVTIEHNVSEGRGAKLQGCQGVGIEHPLQSL